MHRLLVLEEYIAKQRQLIKQTEEDLSKLSALRQKALDDPDKLVAGLTESVRLIS